MNNNDSTPEVRVIDGLLIQEDEYPLPLVLRDDIDLSVAIPATLIIGDTAVPSSEAKALPAINPTTLP